MKTNGFMLYAKMRQSELGEALAGGLKEAVIRVGPEWKEMSKAEREPFEDEAKKLNELARMPGNMTAKTRGRINYPAVALMSDVNGSEAIRDLLDFCVDRARYAFIIINCNYHCQVDDNQFVPSEIGLCAFSMEKGIMDMYWTLVDPGKLPAGTILSARENAETIEIPLPPFEDRFQDLDRITQYATMFIKRYSWNEETGSSVFCMPGQMRVIQGCLDWLNAHAKSQDIEESRIRLLPLDYLGYELYRSPRSSLNQQYLSKKSGKNKMVTPKPPGIPVEPVKNSTQVARALESLNRAFYLEIACPLHQTKSSAKVEKCALGTVNRFAMTMMEMLASHFCINLKPGIHVPHYSPAEDIARRNEFLTNWGYPPSFLNSYQVEEEERDEPVMYTKIKEPQRGQFITSIDTGKRRRFYQPKDCAKTNSGDNQSSCSSSSGRRI